MKLVNAIIIGFVVLSNFTFSQESSKPLELPNFIIEGKEEIDVQVAGKQFPNYQTFMPISIIDTLNYLEKPRSYVVFPFTIPDKIIQRNYPDGYAGIKVGSFVTFESIAGYRTIYKDFNLFGFADFQASRGHINNANYFKYNFGIQSDYVAPEKFYIFGKSKTTSNLNFSGRHYRLYAIDTAPSRSLFDFDIAVVSLGEFEGNNFDVAGKFYLLNQSGLGVLKENSISGNLQFNFPIGRTKVLSNISLNFRQSKGKPANFYEFWTKISSFVSEFSINPLLGIQIGKPTNVSTRVGLHIELPFAKVINQSVTLVGKIYNKLEENSLQSLIKENPYLSDSIELDYSNSTGIAIGTYFYPVPKIFISSEASYIHSSRDLCFDFSSLGLFNVRYLSTNSFKLMLEGRYENEKIGTFAANAVAEISRIASFRKVMPNRPILKIGAIYSRNIFSDLKIVVKFERIGERYADVNNRIKLYAYSNIGLLVNYLYGKNFSFDIELENLLNSNINYWYGYKERGFAFYLTGKYKF